MSAIRQWTLLTIFAACCMFNMHVSGESSPSGAGIDRHPADMSIGADTTGVGPLNLIWQSLSPEALLSSRPGTIQKWIHVTSSYECQGGLLASVGITSSCSCSQASQPTDHAILVSIDLPCGPGPFPIVWLFHGFPQILLNSTWLGTTSNGFETYVNKLVKAGFAVLQYDNFPGGEGPFAQPAEVVETQFAKQVIDWLKILARDEPSSELYQKFDFDNIAVAGHSHGGKLAASIYAKGSVANVYTAFLIDPVDNLCIRPATSNCYPPVIDELKGKNKTMYIFGSTIRGCLNPGADPDACLLGAGCTGTGAADIYKVAGTGSVLDEKPYGHVQLASTAIPGTEELANIFAGYNSSVTNQQAQEYVADRMVAWVKSQLLKEEPSYKPFLEAYEKGQCPDGAKITVPEAGGMAAAPGPAESLGPQETHYGLMELSQATSAEPAPALPSSHHESVA
eukprot:jgi/Botrbrau1/8975/Bobra.0148s0082.1